ncbi:MAG: isopenicillin N synthase family dioxygenase [Actinomycetota bacterium]
MVLVPTIDATSPSRTDLHALDTACRDHGFFLLANHGLDDVLANAWRETERFFDAPRSVRTAIMRDRDNPLGYFDRELTKRKRDHKEVFDFVDPTFAPVDARNRWPNDLPGFRATMTELYDSLSALTDRTLEIVLDALGLTDESRNVITCSRRGSMLRLNHYPVGDPVPEQERDGLADLGPTALGYHTDPGIITLLIQDDTGGLQTQSHAHGWIDVPPQPGTIVVNLGDCMQAYTNDRYRAAVHRVVPITKRRRFSIPYFSNPPREATVAPIAALCDGGVRYRSFAWREFMDARAYDNFADLGADDAQVTDYRVGAAT